MLVLIIDFVCLPLRMNFVLKSSYVNVFIVRCQRNRKISTSSLVHVET